MILLFSWVITILTAILTVDNFLRCQRENNLIFLGKVVSWGFAMLIHLLISLGFWEAAESHTLSKLAWISVSLTELAYRYVKVKWKI